MKPKIRIYEKSGAGMEWHIDDIIYYPEQVEVVLTLENTSDCCTMWKPHDQPLLDYSPNKHSSDGNNCDATPKERKEKQQEQKYRIVSTQTTPNSALILKAGSVEHKVSPLKVGRRVILKMAFVREGAVLDVDMEGHVSHHTKKGGSKQGDDSNGGKRKGKSKKKGSRQKS